MASIKNPKADIDLLSVIDPEDATPHPVMGQMVTARGILKMASCSAFHSTDESSRVASRVMVDRFLPVCEVDQRGYQVLRGGIMSEVRSGAVEIAQGDLFDEGVGGRHSLGPVSARGGEYLNNCALQNFSTSNPAPEDEKKRRDPRFLELEKIGIPTVWLKIAERVGFDTWLDVWRMLSDDESVRHDGGARLPKLRCYSAYSRYQRNRYIEALAVQGTPPRQIQESLRKNLREYLDITNIQRIAKRVKVKAWV